MRGDRRKQLRLSRDSKHHLIIRKQLLLLLLQLLWPHTKRQIPIHHGTIIHRWLETENKQTINQTNN